ncbi:MAG: putative Mg(2+) transport ATPase [Chloroflexi bacterium ADurb.Bin325]|nr:MAG: putative Mg(2+) transport ATPase [Chloroflexi bacterium ADurb.Bin325]
MTTEFIFRLILAGILGAVIGLEREYRAKEAGLRTHFLVTLGSALIMIVSQWGFQTSAGVAGTRPADVARVAAQIVSGIGFLGAGAIIMQRGSVRGLTTAAGLWVAAGIGMAVGGGLYVVGCTTTLLALVGLEVFQPLLRKVKSRYVTLIFTTFQREALVKVPDALNRHGYKVIDYSVTSEGAGATRHLHVQMTILVSAKDAEYHLISFLQRFPDIAIELLE